MLMYMYMYQLMNMYHFYSKVTLNNEPFLQLITGVVNVKKFHECSKAKTTH